MPVQFSPASPIAPARQGSDQYLLIEWDKERVYYLDWVLPGIAPQDFSVLGSFPTGNDFTDNRDGQDMLTTNQAWQQLTQNNYQETGQSGYYLRSRSGLFFLNEASADEPPTLKRLTTNPNNAHYIDTLLLTLLKTDQAVFLEGEALAQIDPNGFTVACPEEDKKGGYFRSNSAIYYIGGVNSVRILSQDSANFQCLPAGFAYDKNHVFLNGDMIRNADPNTFQVFHQNAEYAKDQQHVYYRNLPIPFADASSFGVFEQHLRQQQLAILQPFLDKKIPLSEDICIGYDNQYVYLEGKRIEGISPQQLQLIAAK